MIFQFFSVNNSLRCLGLGSILPFVSYPLPQLCMVMRERNLAYTDIQLAMATADRGSNRLAGCRPRPAWRVCTSWRETPGRTRCSARRPRCPVPHARCCPRRACPDCSWATGSCRRNCSRRSPWRSGSRFNLEGFSIPKPCILVVSCG